MFVSLLTPGKRRWTSTPSAINAAIATGIDKEKATIVPGEESVEVVTAIAAHAVPVL